MSEFFEFVIGAICFFGAVYLAIVPYLILKELRSVRSENRESGLRTVALLQMIARGEKPIPMISDAERLQASIDARMNPE